MNFASINDVQLGGFVGEGAISALQASGCRDVPNGPGVYLVLRSHLNPPDFLPKGTGAGEKPDEKVGDLRSRWVEGAFVVYIGKAGGPDIKMNLRGRLKKYMRFGQGRNSGHSGGKSIWQLRDSGNLLVSWKVTGKAVTEVVEKRLIREFERKYGKLPFANRRH